MRFLFIFVCTFLCLTISSTAHAKRHALVIGNDDYSFVEKLKKAVNDSIAVGDTLTDIGFTVTRLENLKRQEMSLAIHNFVTGLEPGDEVLFYFAGHGVEIRGRNYLLATDIPAAKPNNEDFIIGESFAVDAVIERIRNKGSRVAIVILDACRNNPFPKVGTRSLGGRTRGLALVTAPKGTFVMYSAGVGELALDRLSDEDPHPNSVFTRKLLPLLRKPGIPITSLAKTLQVEVDELAITVEHEQTPAYYDSIKGKYFLVPGDGKTVSPPPPPKEKTIVKNDGQEERLWKAIQFSKKASDFRFYLKQFPNGPNAAIAKLRIEQFKVASLPPKKIIKKEPRPPVTKITRSPGDKFSDCRGCPVMVVIPSGSFTMGSPSHEAKRKADEGPRRHVSISHNFAVGIYEVTKKEFDVFIRASGRRVGGECHIYTGSRWKETSGASYRRPGFYQSDRHPAVCISWYDAQAYVRWLSRATGQSYRLLSEAEWEYVARAGSTRKYAFGNSTRRLCRYGNGADRSSQFSWANRTCSDGYAYTSPAGSFQSNRFGVYDMHGNIWEWVQDCYTGGYYNAPGDQSAVNASNCEKRVLRSGAWNSTPHYLRSATRDKFRMNGRYANGGFRVARDL